MTEADGYVLLALCLLPLGVAMSLFLVPTKQRSIVIALTGISSLAMLALSLYVFFTYRFSGEQFQGVIDLLDMRAVTYNEASQGTAFDVQDIPRDLVAMAGRARHLLLEAIAGHDAAVVKMRGVLERHVVRRQHDVAGERDVEPGACRNPRHRRNDRERQRAQLQDQRIVVFLQRLAGHHHVAIGRHAFVEVLP